MRRAWRLVLVFTLIACVAGYSGIGVKANGSWWDSDWECRRVITFDNSGGSENVIDAVVMIRLDGGNFDFGKIQDDADDMRFVDSDDITALKYFIEKIDVGDELAIIRVKVPQIDNSATDFIYIYYGNDAAVNAEDVNGVFVNGEVLAITNRGSTGELVVDGTASGNDGTIVNAVWGETAKGLDYVEYDGDGSWVDYGDSASLRFTESFSLMTWVRWESDVTSTTIISNQKGNVSGYTLYCDSGDNFRWTIEGLSPSYRVILSDPAIDTWYHGGCVYDSVSGTVSTFLNGVKIESWAVTGTPVVATNNLYFGRYGAGVDELLVGQMTLSKIYNEAIGDSYFIMCYEAEKYLLGVGGGFYSFGDLEKEVWEPGSFQLERLDDYSVGITWVKGVSANKTKVMRRLGAYPETRNDGYEVYYDEGEEYIDNGGEVGLDLDRCDYYYRAWSEGIIWSHGYAEGKIGGGAMEAVALMYLPVIFGMGLMVTGIFVKNQFIYLAVVLMMLGVILNPDITIEWVKAGAGVVMVLYLIGFIGKLR